MGPGVGAGGETPSLCTHPRVWRQELHELFPTGRHLHFECRSHRAEERMSHSRMVPLLLLYTNTLHWCGWNSAAVITSVSSSMFTGLMSTMSGSAVKAERPAVLVSPCQPVPLAARIKRLAAREPSSKRIHTDALSRVG